MAAHAMLSAVIVDDEPLARRELRMLLSAHPEMLVVGDAEDVDDAVALIERTTPDVLFLDIQLSGATGFDLLARVTSDVEVVFVTAFEQHALRAFEVNALAYLLKPVARERLAQVVARLIKHAADSSTATPVASDAADASDAEAPDGTAGAASSAGSSHTESARAPESASAANATDTTDTTDTTDPTDATDAADRVQPPLEYDDRLFLRLQNHWTFVPVSAIQSIVAEGNYSRLTLQDGRATLVSRTLKQWMQRLPARRFLRIHRSIVVNLQQVERIEEMVRGVVSGLSAQRGEAVHDEPPLRRTHPGTPRLIAPSRGSRGSRYVTAPPHGRGGRTIFRLPATSPPRRAPLGT